MDMKRINAGKLRAIGYDSRERILRVEFDDGSAIDYSEVGAEVWRKLSTSGAAWSYYRDNIEEEYTGRRGRAQPRPSGPAFDPFAAGDAPAAPKRSPLDDLFAPPDDKA